MMTTKALKNVNAYCSDVDPSSVSGVSDAGKGFWVQKILKSIQ